LSASNKAVMTAWTLNAPGDAGWNLSVVGLKVFKAKMQFSSGGTRYAFHP
jgi:hypothetical protein